MHLKSFAIAFFTFIALDYIFLAKLMSRFYLSELGPLARVADGKFAPQLLPAAVVYLALAAGVVFFVLPRVQQQGGGPVQALIWGGLFGFIVYAVYDMTNLSLVNGWSAKLSLVDMIWGTILCGTTSALGEPHQMMIN